MWVYLDSNYETLTLLVFYILTIWEKENNEKIQWPWVLLKDGIEGVDDENGMFIYI